MNALQRPPVVLQIQIITDKKIIVKHKRYGLSRIARYGVSAAGHVAGIASDTHSCQCVIHVAQPIVGVFRNGQLPPKGFSVPGAEVGQQKGLVGPSVRTHDVPGVKRCGKVEPHTLKGNGQIRVTVVEHSALQLAHLSLRGQNAIILPRRILVRIHGALENAETDCFFLCRPPDRCGQAAVKITEWAELHISA